MIPHKNIIDNIGRGSILYTRKDLVGKEVEFKIPRVKEKFEEGIFYELNLKGHDKLLCACIYRRGESDDKNNELLLKLFKMMAEKKYSYLIIMGDFNLPKINWETLYCNTSDEDFHVKFVECVNDCFLFQHVNEPTRVRGANEPNVLDLIFSNEEGMVKNLIQEAPLGKSDHSVLRFTVKCTPEKQPPQIKSFYEKANYKKMIDMFNESKWEEKILEFPDDVEAQWKIFRDIYSAAEKECVPKKKVFVDGVLNKKLSVPLDEKNLAKLKKKHRIWSKMRKKLADDQQKTEYRRCSNQIRALTRKGSALIQKTVAGCAKTNPKAFWKYSQQKLKTRSGIPDLVTQIGGNNKSDTFTKTDQEKADTFSKQFSSVFTTEPDSNDMPYFEEKIYEEALSTIDITEAIVMDKLTKIKQNKSPGPDNIHPRVLYETRESISKFITIIFTTSLRTKTLPMEWKHARVSAIYKKNNKTVPLNYRPVSLTCILCKTMESIIRDHIVMHMVKNNLFSPKQFGFISGRSTTLQLLHVIEIWSQILDQGGNIDSIYCDFMKAFDKVPHKRLVYKVSKYGIKGDVIGWIDSFLSNRTQCVSIGEAESETMPVTSGIPQGSVLGPLLFVIYINDLPDVVDKDTFIFLFADDTKAFRDIKSVPDQIILQNDVKNLTEWSDIWLLKFHPDKCVAMHFGNSNTKFDYVMEGHVLDKSKCEKDIGVYVDDKLNFEYHIYEKIKKANKILAIIRRTFTKMDANIFCQLFKGLVRPHLEYAQAVWSPQSKTLIRKIEEVQKRATKLIPGFYNLSYQDRLRKLNLPTLAYRRARGDMIEVYKMLAEKGGYDQALPCLFTRTSSLHDRPSHWSHSKQVYHLGSKNNILLHSFTHRVQNTWNNLPEEVVKATSLDKDGKEEETIIAFERELDRHWADQDLLYNYEAKIVKKKWCDGIKPRPL